MVHGFLFGRVTGLEPEDEYQSIFPRKTDRETWKKNVVFR
jgi:hypothetical protein